MGNSRCTGSLKHNAEKDCKKLSFLKKHKHDVLQRLLQDDNTCTISLIFSFNFFSTYASYRLTYNFDVL
jgi:hypothetical protein